jgi:hypothetical protein
MIDLSEVRKSAWETRRAKYGERGHRGSYSRTGPTSIQALYAAHQQWSEQTFGTEKGPIGPLKHLINEAEEAIENPADIMEYVDCFFLITDAVRRAGYNLNDLTEAGFEKLEILKQRTYERTPEGEPSFHVKGKS